jgi:hypothetical protein
MLIVYHYPGDIGWGPINHMVRVAAEAFGAHLVVIDRERRPTTLQQLSAIFSHSRGAESCLVVAPDPYDITFFLLVDGWRTRFRSMAAWIIDSFWTNRLPWLSRHARLFDHLFVTTEEDVPHWQRTTRTPTSHLPWGTDALRLGSAKPDRNLDLLRVGRQPPDWEDDRMTARACRGLGIRFSGRPTYRSSAVDAQPALMTKYAESRYVLAFSNAVNATSYTHPTREYLTGRWVDALACGAVVAGVAPATPDASRLLWPGATLDLGGVSRDEGLRVVAGALRDWSPERARVNHRNALERLDWRWRFEEIASVLGESPPQLRAELDEIRRELFQIDRVEATATSC